MEAPWNKEGKNEHFHFGGKVRDVSPAINTVEARIHLFLVVSNRPAYREPQDQAHDGIEMDHQSCKAYSVLIESLP